MSWTETDRYGEALQQVTVEQVVNDLVNLPADLVIAICASLVIAHEPYTWPSVLESLKDFKENEG